MSGISQYDLTAFDCLINKIYLKGHNPYICPNMKVSGFTFVKNAIQFGYPVLESIKSILPLCDEVIVSVGDSTDDTLALIQSIPSTKIRIFSSIWDQSINEAGKILAVETDKAFQKVSTESSWCIYLQADEVLHEKDYPQIRKAMNQYLGDQNIEGLLFDYTHFYGSYSTIGISSNFYRHEVRIIRNNPQIYSYRDAQGFRIRDDEKLSVKSIDAGIYHYGWAREPKVMANKYLSFNKLWYKSKKIDESIRQDQDFNYAYKEYCVVPFKGSHPKVMQERVSKQNWNFDERLYRNRLSWKDRGKLWIKKYLGLDFNYQNYILVKS